MRGSVFRLLFEHCILQLTAHGVHGIRGQAAAKLVEVVYKSEHEKSIRMLKMVERHVLVFLLNNKTVVQTHVLLVILLILLIYINLKEIVNLYVYPLVMTK